MILDEIVKDKRKRLIEHKARIEEEKMRKLALQSNRRSISFYEALKKEGLSIIGEFKKASPSMGNIHSRISFEERIAQYNQSVDAISCLTEEDHFHGNIQYLEEIRKRSPLPIIRKDFIIEEYQVYEAKVIGADAILLIAAILKDAEMKILYELAYSLGLDVLLEVHNEEEMQRAMDLGAKIIGVNNRDLRDFTISLETTKRLNRYLEERTGGKRPVLVSESGVTSADDIAFLKECQADAILIGRSFMEAESPLEKVQEWKMVYNH